MEKAAIKIKGLRGGAVDEISQFLADMEGAYNALYHFDRKIVRWDRRRRYWKRYIGPEELFYESHSEFPNFGDQIILDGEKENILPIYRLELTRVSIQSPGFWEFMGSLNPLQQLREYLNDRHKRRQDKEFREVSEKRKLELENELLVRQIMEKENSVLRERFQLMKEAGISQDEIEQFIWGQIGKPISKIAKYQDSGLIEGSKEKDIA